MRREIAADATAAARIAAAKIGAACREAVAVRGRALLAMSGGETPWLMLQVLRDLDLPWPAIHVAQVDERVAPDGDSRRNLTRLERILVREGPLPAMQLLSMPVLLDDLDDAAWEYQHRLETTGGTPLVIDLVQLGLGPDGHTASLVPGDPVLDILDRDVAVTGPYQGLRRMTLTFPAINRARRRLWLVTGANKAARLRDLEKGTFRFSNDRDNRNVPFFRVNRDHTTVVADEAALRGDPSPG